MDGEEVATIVVDGTLAIGGFLMAAISDGGISCFSNAAAESFGDSVTLNEIVPVVGGAEGVKLISVIASSTITVSIWILAFASGGGSSFSIFISRPIMPLAALLVVLEGGDSFRGLGEATISTSSLFCPKSDAAFVDNAAIGQIVASVTDTSVEGVCSEGTTVVATVGTRVKSEGAVVVDVDTAVTRTLFGIMVTSPPESVIVPALEFESLGEITRVREEGDDLSVGELNPEPTAALAVTFEDGRSRGTSEEDGTTVRVAGKILCISGGIIIPQLFESLEFGLALSLLTLGFVSRA